MPKDDNDNGHHYRPTAGHIMADLAEGFVCAEGVDIPPAKHVLATLWRKHKAEESRRVAETRRMKNLLIALVIAFATEMIGGATFLLWAGFKSVIQQKATP